MFTEKNTSLNMCNCIHCGAKTSNTCRKRKVYIFVAILYSFPLSDPEISQEGFLQQESAPKWQVMLRCRTQKKTDWHKDLPSLVCFISLNNRPVEYVGKATPLHSSLPSKLAFSHEIDRLELE